MNAEQLQAIKERAEKATPGPWVIEESRFGNFNAASVNENYDLPACLMNDADAQFVTNAREDIPILIAEVERLQALADFEVKCTIKANRENKQLRDALVKIESMLHEVAPGANSDVEMKQQFHTWFLEACYTAELALAGDSND